MVSPSSGWVNAVSSMQSGQEKHAQPTSIPLKNLPQIKYRSTFKKSQLEPRDTEVNPDYHPTKSFNVPSKSDQK
jgi:hypothetical protein